jgi:hypothetical protein
VTQRRGVEVNLSSKGGAVTVILELRVDWSILAEDRKSVVASADAVALDYTYFVLPVRLAVDGMEVLEYPRREPRVMWAGDPVTRELVPIPSTDTGPGPWLELPVLHVATIGLETVRGLAESDTATYMLPGADHIRFARVGECVQISVGHTGPSASAPYQQVLDAFERFAGEVRRLLAREVPEILEHPYWGPWIQGAVDR